MTTIPKKRVVIIGGGFGGIYSAQNLKSLIEAGSVEVTIISKTNYFLFTPLLHEVATGGLAPTSVVEPIREIFRRTNIHFIEDAITWINSDNKEVTTVSSGIIPYDYLVVSLGAETNYYGIPGAETNSFTLKNLDDAVAFRQHILLSCEKAAATQDADERRKLLSCAIVGAGPTGVELAAELVELMHDTMCAYYHECNFDKEHMKISLVAASADVLPMFPPELRAISQHELEHKGVSVMLNMKVTEVSPGKISFGDGTFIEANTIVWVAGVKPVDVTFSEIEKEKNGRIKIDEFLRVAGKENIFALGDISGTGPMLAQVAKQQGKTVAQNIAFSITGEKPVAFVYHEKGLLVSLGQWYAAGKIYGVTMKGPIMWWIWRTIYLFNFQSWRKRIKIAGEWTAGLFYPRDITQI